MSPDPVEAALALWRAYDLAVIADRRATAAVIAASKTWHPPKARRRQLPPEAAPSRAASILAATAKAMARNAYHALGPVFDESPNEAAGDPGPCEPPPPVAVGTREPVRFGTFGGGTAWHGTPGGCGARLAPGE
jgi:hypothetical protein